MAVFAHAVRPGADAGKGSVDLDDLLSDLMREAHGELVLEEVGGHVRSMAAGPVGREDKTIGRRALGSLRHSRSEPLLAPF